VICDWVIIKLMAEHLNMSKEAEQWILVTEDLNKLGFENFASWSTIYVEGNLLQSPPQCLKWWQLQVYYHRGKWIFQYDLETKCYNCHWKPLFLLTSKEFFIQNLFMRARMWKRHSMWKFFFVWEMQFGRTTGFLPE